ncbi:MAG: DUF739 family protein [Lachnospira pectinoschiza]
MKLKGKIIEKYGSLGKFAKELNISRTSMSKKMNCQSGFSQSDIEKWSSMLDIKSSEYGTYFFN